MTLLDQIVIGWISLASLTAFFLFGFDKRCAKKARRRISEWNLVLVSAMGGWPGGLLAMFFFRHKTAKATFQLKFAIAFIVFATGLGLYLHYRWNAVNPFPTADS